VHRLPRRRPPRDRTRQPPAEQLTNRGGALVRDEEPGVQAVQGVFHQGSENSGWLNHKLVESAAASIPGVDVPGLLAASSSPSVSAQAAAFDRDAAADGVRVTPTILVGRTGGSLTPVTLKSAGDSASIAAAIDAALR